MLMSGESRRVDVAISESIALQAKQTGLGNVSLRSIGPCGLIYAKKLEAIITSRNPP